MMGLKSMTSYSTVLLQGKEMLFDKIHRDALIEPAAIAYVPTSHATDQNILLLEFNLTKPNLEI